MSTSRPAGGERNLSLTYIYYPTAGYYLSGASSQALVVSMEDRSTSSQK